jgi:hypothetical protein
LFERIGKEYLEMNTPPSRKLIRRIVIIWIVIIIIFALVYGLFFSPLSPFHRCTLMGCRDSLELTLSHEPPTQYTLLLTSSTGESRSVTCTPGETSAASDTSALCRTGIVTIYGFAPGDVTVSITWEGGSYSMRGSPVYQTFHPNGISCPPSCQSGRLSVELP